MIWSMDGMGWAAMGIGKVVHKHMHFGWIVHGRIGFFSPVAHVQASLHIKSENKNIRAVHWLHKQRRSKILVKISASYC